MKSKLLIILFSFTLLGVKEASQINSVSVRLQLSVKRDKRFGTLMAIKIGIENTSNQKLYLDGILPLSVNILKKQNGSYQDYSAGWVSDEVNNNERNGIGEAIGQAKFQERACKFGSDDFIDPFVLNFFRDQIKNKDFIKTKQDSSDLRLWVCRQFNGLLYLNAHELIESIDGINSLPPGAYKIFFQYSNKNGYVRKISPYERFEKFQLPDDLNGFLRWRGEIKPDTLFLNIE